MNKKLVCTFVSILVAAGSAASQGSLVGTVIEDGLQKITFEVPAGKIKVFLPDDAGSGGKISGTVLTEPNGKDSTEKSKNSDVLGGYLIDLGDGTTVKTDEPRFTWVPAAPPAPKPRYQIRLIEVIANDHQTVASGPIIPEPLNPPGKKTPLPINGPIIPEPVNGPSAPRYSIQPLGQTGRPFTINGNFDGDASNTKVTVGGSTVPVIAESARKTIVQSPVNIVGATEVKVTEGSTTTASGAFRNLKIDLTAPKTSLMKGESTELKVEVQGLQGITSPVPVQIVTTGGVNMQGGNTQTINIQPSQVGPNGAVTQTFGLTGTTAGGFSVVTTVLSGPWP